MSVQHTKLPQLPTAAKSPAKSPSNPDYIKEEPEDIYSLPELPGASI